MNDRGLRHKLLRSSVQKLVDEQPGDPVVTSEIVVLWTRHRWFFPYAAFAGVVMFGVASAVGIEGVVNRLAIGAAGVALAAVATTNYWIIARTTGGLVLCRSSRIRQYATSLVGRLSPDVEMKMVGSTMITSEWRIDGVEYTLTKRWEATMRAISMDPDPPKPTS